MKEFTLSLVIKAKDLASGALNKTVRSMKAIPAVAGKVSAGFKRIGASVLNLKTALVGAIASFGLFKTIADFTDAAATFETLEQRMTALMGSIEGGARATAWVKQFTADTPYQLEQVTDGFIKLKAFGIDPTGGAYQAIADQAAKLGGGQETLNGIILAVGQAWGKQKLQGEEILQLIERGVPVWDLLAKATGKNALELQELSTQGKLGRDTIAGLVEEMGKGAEGAAAGQMGTWAGLVSNVKDAWMVLQSTIMGGGLFDFLKEKLAETLAVLTYVVESGLARKWGEDIGAAVRDIGTWVEKVTEHFGTLVSSVKLVLNGFTAAVRATVMAVSGVAAKILETQATINEFLGFEGAAEKARKGAALMTSVFEESLGQLKGDIDDISDALKGFGDKQKDSSRSWQQLVTDAKAFNAEAKDTTQAAGDVGESMAEAARRAGLLGEAAKANTATLQAELSKQKKITDEFAGLVAEMRGEKPGAEAQENIGLLDVGIQKNKAAQALTSGDFDGAIQQARLAADMLRQLKEQGSESNLVLAGMAMFIEQIGVAAAKAKTQGEQPIIDAEKNKAAVQDTLRQMQDMGAKGVELTVKTNIDRTDLEDLSATPITIPIRLNVIDGVPTYSDSAGTMSEESAKRGYRP